MSVLAARGPWLVSGGVAACVQASRPSAQSRDEDEGNENDNGNDNDNDNDNDNGRRAIDGRTVTPRAWPIERVASRAPQTIAGGRDRLVARRGSPRRGTPGRRYGRDRAQRAR